MESYLNNWTIARVLQLIVGVFFIIDYIYGDTFFSIVFGGMMFGQAMLNVGCFSSKGCSVPNERKTSLSNQHVDDVEYEIIEEKALNNL